MIGVAVTSGKASPPVPNNDKQTCPASFSCPENNGCSYTDGIRTLVLSCGVDFYGGDYANQYANSLKACTQACASNTRCVAASFVGGKDAGTCYLKGTKKPGNIDYKINGKLSESVFSDSFVIDIISCLRRRHHCAVQQHHLPLILTHSVEYHHQFNFYQYLVSHRGSNDVHHELQQHTYYFDHIYFFVRDPFADM